MEMRKNTYTAVPDSFHKAQCEKKKKKEISLHGRIPVPSHACLCHHHCPYLDWHDIFRSKL